MSSPPPSPLEAPGCEALKAFNAETFQDSRLLPSGSQLFVFIASGSEKGPNEQCYQGSHSHSQ